MSNFEYIISSLPFLTSDYKYSDGQGFDSVIGEIRENLSEADAQELDFLLKGLRDSQLDADFYAEALAHKDLAVHLRLDLRVGNAAGVHFFLNVAVAADIQREMAKEAVNICQCRLVIPAILLL